MTPQGTKRSEEGQGFLGSRTWLGSGQVRQVCAPAGFEPARFGLDFDFWMPRKMRV